MMFVCVRCLRKMQPTGRSPRFMALIFTDSPTGLRTHCALLGPDTTVNYGGSQREDGGRKGRPHANNESSEVCEHLLPVTYFFESFDLAWYDHKLLTIRYLQAARSERCAGHARQVSIESSPVWDTSCLAELIYDLNNKQFLCGKCPKPVTIQYLRLARLLVVTLGRAHVTLPRLLEPLAWLAQWDWAGRHYANGRRSNVRIKPGCGRETRNIKLWDTEPRGGELGI